MVTYDYDPHFKKCVRKLPQVKRLQVKKPIEKIVQKPTIGKPMQYRRKGTREVYAKPFRLAYAYRDDHVILLDLYHKDEQ